MESPVKEIIIAALDPHLEWIRAGHSLRMRDILRIERAHVNHALVHVLCIPEDRIDWNVSEDALNAISSWLPGNTYGNTIEDVWWRIRCLLILCATPPGQVICRWTARLGHLDTSSGLLVDWDEVWKDIQVMCSANVRIEYLSTWGCLAHYIWENPRCALLPWRRASEGNPADRALLRDAMAAIEVVPCRALPGTAHAPSKLGHTSRYRLLKLQLGSDLAFNGARPVFWAVLELAGPAVLLVLISILWFALMYMCTGMEGLIICSAMLIACALTVPQIRRRAFMAYFECASCWSDWVLDRLAKRVLKSSEEELLRAFDRGRAAGRVRCEQCGHAIRGIVSEKCPECAALIIPAYPWH